MSSSEQFSQFFKRIYRIVWNAIDAFNENQDYLKASALTFYTLISIVPFLAVAFGIATGFGFEQYLEERLKSSFEEQEFAIVYAINFARSLLLNVKSSVVAGIGLVTLLWTNLSMFGNIENALNDIWKVKKPRTWSKKLVDYLAAMIICPIVFVLSSSLSVYLMTEITETAKANHLFELMSPYLLMLFKLVPFLLSILLFIVVYLFIPNVKIRSQSRIGAGVLAGVAFQLWQWVYIKFQVEISSYDAVYGTFAALPLFLIWVQVSWLIVLVGAEFAAQIENELSRSILSSRDRLCEISNRELGLLVLYHCIYSFTKGRSPPTTFQLAQEIGIPFLTAQQIIDMLEETNILVEVVGKGHSYIGYQPSKDPSLFTIKSVLKAIERQTQQPVYVENSSILMKIQHSLLVFEETEETSEANLNFHSLLKGEENGEVKHVT